MDKSTYENIVKNAQLIAEFASAAQQLREITRVLSFGKKEVLGIAKMLESSPEALFNPAILRAYRIYLILLKHPNQSPKSIAAKIGASASTVQQTIIALKSGGVSIPGRTERDIKPSSTATQTKTRSGKGPEFANENRSNDQRVDEVVAAVEDAVAKLSQEHNWDELSVRERIKLLQQETREARGVAVSSQTLYREWLRDLW